MSSSLVNTIDAIKNMIVISHARLQINVPSLPLLSRFSVSLNKKTLIEKQKQKKTGVAKAQKSIFFQLTCLENLPK